MRYGTVDTTYLIFVLPALLFTLWAQFRVKTTFAKHQRTPSDRNMTGADAARLVLEQNGVTGVTVTRIAGQLTDHYDPKENVIRLSESVYDARTAAAVGVAAHEAGHAVQYAVGYAPIHVRQTVIPATKIGTYAAWPLFIVGMIFSARPLQLAGIILFSACVLFQLLTLPVEINASRRAVKSLETAGLSEEGLKAAKSVLTAAALTYVAALASAIANLLRLISLFSSGSRRR